MDYYNTRFADIWQILIQHLDFDKKVVLDVGCGHGDLIRAACDAGALVYGIDKKIVNKLRADSLQRTGRLLLMQQDINAWSNTSYPLKDSVDILTCFSVLPYLNRPFEMLGYFKRIASTVVIEMQYFGDGPGLEQVKNDNDMKAVLKILWQDVEKIGSTVVKSRNKERSIWLCR